VLTNTPPRFARLAAAISILTFAATAAAHQNEESKLTAPDGAPADRFGASADIDHDWAAVGAPGDDDNGAGSGSVYVYSRTGSTWNFHSKLNSTIASTGERFGDALDLDLTTLVVGAPDNEPGSLNPGAAYVFVRSGGTWTEQVRLLPFDGAPLDAFGAHVSISGNTVLVGAPRHNETGEGSGKVYVFTRSGGIWTLEASFAGLDTNAGDGFGTAVSLDGNRAVIGAPLDSDVLGQAGSAYVFSRSGTTWSQVAKLVDPAPGMGDQFGSAVHLQDSQNQLVVGVPLDDDLGADSGSVVLFDDVAGTWTFNQRIMDPSQAPGDQAGGAVQVRDEFVISCARFDDEEAPDAGKAWLFIEAAGVYGEEALVASDATSNLFMGTSFGITACWGISGAPGDSTKGVNAGAAYIYDLAYPPEAYCTAGTSASGCTPTITAIGHASASDASGFALAALGVEGAKDGLFFFSTNGRQANSWGSGTSFQCVVPPVIRGGLQLGNGTPGLCDNSVVQDMNALWCPTCPKPAKNPGPGAIVQAQFWYRDPLNTSNQTTSISGAIEFEVCP